MSTQELAQKVARVAEQAKGGQQLKTVDDLLRRGGTLRVKTTSVTEPDAYARRYRHAGIAGAQDAIAKALATSFAPVEVNLWLESVARFVDANFSEYSDRIVPRALTKSEPQVIIDAIDQNFAVLRLIKAGLET